MSGTGWRAIAIDQGRRAALRFTHRIKPTADEEREILSEAEAVVRSRLGGENFTQEQVAGALAIMLETYREQRREL